MHDACTCVWSDTHPLTPLYPIQGMKPKAVECYILASVLQPDLGAAWLRLGGACRDAGMYVRAVRAFSRALEVTGGRGDDGDEALGGLVYCKQVGYVGWAGPV